MQEKVTIDILPTVQRDVVQALQELFDLSISAETLVFQLTPSGFEGEFSLPTFPLSNRLSKPPQDFAAELTAHLRLHLPTIDHCEWGQGFLNIGFTESAWMTSLYQAVAAAQHVESSPQYATPLLSAEKWVRAELAPHYEQSILIRQFAQARNLLYPTDTSLSLDVPIHSTERHLFQRLALAHTFSSSDQPALRTSLRQLIKAYQKFLAAVPLLNSDQFSTTALRFSLNHMFGVVLSQGIQQLKTA